MIPLELFRSKIAGLPDLLNYAALIAPGVVQGKDGSLMAGFFYRGDDAESSSDADRNSLTELVNAYLTKFDSRWAVWVEAIRMPSPGYPDRSLSHFPDVVSRLIEEERREMFERKDKYFESEYVLVFQYLPPKRRESKLAELLYHKNDEERSFAEKIISGFKATINGFQEGLGRSLNMRRMGTIVAGPKGYEYDSDELVNYLHFCLTGEMVALRIPSNPMYLDTWIGAPSMWPGEILQVGDKFVSCVGIDGFPSHSYPGMLSFLDGLPIAYRWSTRFIFLEQHQAISALEKFHRLWTQIVRGFKSQAFNLPGMPNLDAAEMAASVVVSMKDARSGKVGFGYYTPVIVLTSENLNLLKEQAGYVKKEIERWGYSARVESENTQEAWLGTLPGHTRPNVRRPPMHTLNLSDLLPLAGVWAGEETNPCPFYPDNSPSLMQVVTTGSTPLRLNLHVSDVGHTLIFGPTGTGKSALLETLKSQARRYQSKLLPDGSTVPATIMGIDRGGSAYATCSALGGTYYDIGADDSKVILCPLAEIDSPSDAMWAKEWIATCYELQVGKAMDSHQKNEVHLAITRMKGTPRELRSMSKFVSSVQEKGVQNALKHYTNEGTMGQLLDGIEDSVTISNFTAFDIDELMSLRNENAIPVLLYLFRRFLKSLKGQPAYLFLDEASVMLEHTVFMEQLRKFLKELRKLDCAVIIATQSLSDAVRSGMLDVLIESCPTKIFLPNNEADSYGTEENPGPYQIYKMFGMNDREIQIIKTMQPKKQYYYKSTLGRRVFELSLGPLALSFVGVSDKDLVRKAKAMEIKHGSDWPLHWMKERGVDYAKYLPQ